MASRIGLEYIVRLSTGEPVVVKSHSGPDIDETAASFLIEAAGTPEWLADRTNQGTVHLGVTPDASVGLAGIYDEHHDRDRGGDDSRCCATLVADTLGIADDVVLQKIVEYALKEDSKGTGSTPTLARLMKDHRNLGWDDQLIVAWVHRGLRAWVAVQRRFITDHGLEAWEQMIKTEEGLFRFPIISNCVNDLEWTTYGLSIHSEAERQRSEARDIIIMKSLELSYGSISQARRGCIRVLIHVENAFLLDAAWKLSDEGVADAILIIKPGGNFQIFANGRKGFTLQATLELLTVALLESKGHIPDGCKTFEQKRDYIKAKGWAVPGKQVWGQELYLWPKGPAIFNGSMTGDVDPIAGIILSYERIYRILERGLLEERRTNVIARRGNRPERSSSRSTTARQTPAPSPEPSPSEGESTPPSPEGSA